MPNITTAAPPSTAGGIAEAIADSLGNRPRMIRKMPPMVTTWRLTTPVRATRPTFCA